MRFRLCLLLVVTSWFVIPLAGCTDDQAGVDGGDGGEQQPATTASDTAEHKSSPDSTPAAQSSDSTNAGTKLDLSEFIPKTSRSEPISASLVGLKFEIRPYTIKEDGKIRVQGMQKEYTNGELRRHGKHTFYYTDEKKQSSGDYTDGKKSGEWTFWHPNGQKSKQGRYVEGLAEGKWTAWYENGKIRSEGNYSHSDKVGTWTTYDIAGKSTTQDYSANATNEH